MTKAIFRIQFKIFLLFCIFYYIKFGKSYIIIFEITLFSIFADYSLKFRVTLNLQKMLISTLPYTPPPLT